MVHTNRNMAKEMQAMIIVYRNWNLSIFSYPFGYVCEHEEKKLSEPK